MIAWSRLAIVRSGSGISVIFASTALSPSALLAAAFSSWARSFIAARSSSVNPLDFLLTAVLLLVGFGVSFFRLIETSLSVHQASWMSPIRLPSASRTLAISLPPPTSLMFCSVWAPASRSVCKLSLISLT